MSGSQTRRIGVVATDPLRFVGLQSILSQATDIQLLPLTGQEALNSSNLNAVLVDASCTDHLFELLSAFRKSHPRTRVIVIGLEESPEHIQRVIGAGAKGYLSHAAHENEIRQAVEIVLDGSIWAPRKVLARLLESQRSNDGAGAGLRLTHREREVLTLLVAGRPNREIAHMLGIDESTVKAHVGRLMRKTGVDNRTALSMQTVSRGLLNPPDM